MTPEEIRSAAKAAMKAMPKKGIIRPSTRDNIHNAFVLVFFAELQNLELTPKQLKNCVQETARNDFVSTSARESVDTGLRDSNGRKIFKTRRLKPIAWSEYIRVLEGEP